MPPAVSLGLRADPPGCFGPRVFFQSAKRQAAFRATSYMLAPDSMCAHLPKNFSPIPKIIYQSKKQYRTMGSHPLHSYLARTGYCRSCEKLAPSCLLQLGRFLFLKTALGLLPVLLKKMLLPALALSSAFLAPHAASRALSTSKVAMNGGKGFGGGEATRDPAPTSECPHRASTTSPC